MGRETDKQTEGLLPSVKEYANPQVCQYPFQDTSLDLVSWLLLLFVFHSDPTT